MAKSTQNAKQQVIDKVNDVDAVLVALNSSPSVDELSAALGLTLALNKQGKHATAVFSGEVPMAIEFLEPGKTFENTVDSLRDFIIALDKEKADHLRYKVEGEMVKIFITPYRTTIDDRDLEFSQGDYNVEMVFAIGVRDENDLDRALTDHGRIMHDATVVGISIGEDSSDLGSISWHDAEASSYSELLAEFTTKLKGDKKILDEQIATAFLTGIVAATDRFSNENTTSSVMTLSAQLMAAGANQHLIATQLEQAEELSRPAGISMSGITSEGSGKNSREDGSVTLNDNVRTKVSHDDKGDTLEELEEKVKDKQAADGSLTISHDVEQPKDEVDEAAQRVEKEKQEAATEQAEAILAQSLASSSPSAAPGLSVEDLQSDLAAAAANNAESDAPATNQQLASSAPQDMTLPSLSNEADNFIETPITIPEPAVSSPVVSSGPSFGGTLNATSEQAAADKRREEEADRNKTILSHDGGSYAPGAPAGYPAVNSFSDSNAAVADTTPPATMEPPSSVSSRGHDLQPLSGMPSYEPTGPTLAEIDSQNRGHEQPAAANDAMAEALSVASTSSAQQQHVPDVTALPPLPSSPQVSDPSIGGLPPLPPMPDFSALPPLPPTETPQLPTVAPQNQGEVPNQVQASPADPAAFQIPSQN